MRILERDRNFWGPAGGVTFGGGEPLVQRDFLLAALRACRNSYIHTAMETCAHVPYDDLMAALDLLDWLFVDLKHMDPNRHRSETGTGNQLILGNVRSIAESDWPGRLVVRVPIVPGFNDDIDNIEATAEFMSTMGLDEVHLLPFHRLGASKYQQLGLDWPFKDTSSPTTATMRRLAESFEQRGIRCHAGADTPF